MNYEYLPIEQVKVGDIVECIMQDISGKEYTKDKIYIVKKVYKNGIDTVYDDKGSTKNGFVKTCFKLIKTKPGSEAKVGDTIIHTKTDFPTKYRGDIPHGYIGKMTNSNSKQIQFDNLSKGWGSIKNVKVLCKAKPKETWLVKDIEDYKQYWQSIHEAGIEYKYKALTESEWNFGLDEDCGPKSDNDNIRYCISADEPLPGTQEYFNYWQSIKDDNKVIQHWYCGNWRDTISDSLEGYSEYLIFRRKPTSPLNQKLTPSITQYTSHYEKISDILHDMENTAENAREYPSVREAGSRITQKGWINITSLMDDLKDYVNDNNISVNELKTYIIRQGSPIDEELEYFLEEKLRCFIDSLGAQQGPTECKINMTNYPKEAIMPTETMTITITTNIQEVLTDLEQAPNALAMVYDPTGNFKGVTAVDNKDEAIELLQQPSMLGCTVKVFKAGKTLTTAVPVVEVK